MCKLSGKLWKSFSDSIRYGYLISFEMYDYWYLNWFFGKMGRRIYVHGDFMFVSLKFNPLFCKLFFSKGCLSMYIYSILNLNRKAEKAWKSIQVSLYYHISLHIMNTKIHFRNERLKYNKNSSYFAYILLKYNKKKESYLHLKKF